MGEANFERVAAEKQREFGHTLAALLVVIAIVMLAARLMGAAMLKVGQPRVMGEVIAGILLGPTLLGAIAPEVQAASSRPTSSRSWGPRPTSG